MLTLAHWSRRLGSTPSTIECPDMQLKTAEDGQPPVFVGPGYIRIKSSTEIDFTMFATSREGGDAFKRLVRARENPYEVLDQFRLFATNYEGTDWTCGWTTPRLKGAPRGGWPLTGSLDSLVTDVSEYWVSTEPSAELVFDQELPLPMEKSMVSVTEVDGEEVHRQVSSGKQVVRALDSEIQFF